MDESENTCFFSPGKRYMQNISLWSKSWTDGDCKSKQPNMSFAETCRYEDKKNLNIQVYVQDTWLINTACLSSMSKEHQVLISEEVQGNSSIVRLCLKIDWQETQWDNMFI